MDPIKKVAIVGSGNLATNLAIALKKEEIQIAQVYSNSWNNAKVLADKVGSKAISNLNDLDKNIDLIILSVTDSAYETILREIKSIEIPIAHTGGSIPVDIFHGKFKEYGVFYLFQTFTKERIINFENIPICIEANNKQLLNQLEELGKSISKRIYELNSEQRKKLHLSGIVANNFSNYLFTLAKDYLEKEGMKFDILLPLLQETIEKLKYLTPEKAQTGPAVRGNKNVIEKHEEMLKGNPQLAKLYSLISENIMDYYGKS